MMQLSLLDALRSAPIIRPVAPYGSVVQGEATETLRLPHARGGLDRARIGLHQHVDGLWMWSTNWCANGGGSGYKVGPKWGNFARSRDDALHYAVAELEKRIGSPESAVTKDILKWSRGLQ